MHNDAPETATDSGDDAGRRVKGLVRYGAPAALLVALVATFALWPRSGSDLAADRDAAAATISTTTTTTTTQPTTTEPTTTSAPATTEPAPPTTAAPTTAAPTTAAPPTPPPTAAPAPPPPPPPPPPAPPRPAGPMTVLVIGDSLGFTASFPPPNAHERPDYISRIDSAAIIACGVLNVAGWTVVDAEGDGADWLGQCPQQALKELQGLAKHPDWMVMFSGGWEHLPWIPPGASDPLPARSAPLRAALRDEMIRRANGAAAVGTRTAFVTWVCPSDTTPTRRGDYALWYNAILRDAAAAVPGAIVVEPSAAVCARGDASSFPTQEKDVAFGHGYHPKDKHWLWNRWIGPVLRHHL